MPFLNAWKKNFLRYLETWIGVSVSILLLGGLCLGVPMLLEDVSDVESAPILLVGGAIAFLVIVFGAALAYALVVLRGRRNRLNTAFAFPEVSARSLMLNGRQYHGIVDKRSMDAYYFRGPTLEMYLSTALQTRAGIGPRNALGTLLAGAMQKTPLTLPEGDYAGCEAYADDAIWAGGWLADPDVRAALTRLLQPADDAEWRVVTMQPGSIRFLLRYTEEDRITVESVRDWLTDLAVVLAAAERRAAPTVASKPLSGVERMSQENRGAFTLPAFLMVLGFLLIPTICFVVALVVLVSMPGSR
jgi:hypothetical protein